MTHVWNPNIYSQFLDLRTRPARDLLNAIPNTIQPRSAYDLGCGTGNSTILLQQRWPQAKVIGIDSSSDMLKEAKLTYPDLEFIKEDIAQFSPTEKVDALFANASLQWVDDHETLIPKLASFLNPNGVIAIQMPNNFHSPTHQVTIQLLQNNPAWQHFLKNLRYGALTKPFYQLPWHYDLLSNSGLHDLQIWETEYFQEMNSYEDIFTWVKGTGLRPVLSAMDSETQTQFRNAYIGAIAKEYPLQTNNKILMPFRRIFMVGIK